MKKPDKCSACPLNSMTTGFVPDLVPPGAAAKFIFRWPASDDLIASQPMSGKGGRAWEHKFLRKVTGLSRQDVAFGHLIRCRPNGGKRPTGDAWVKGIKYCQKTWAEKEFKPDVYIVAPKPGDLLEKPNHAIFMTRSLEKTAQYVAQGQKPCVLMGQEVMENKAPHLTGGMKRWTGHHWRADGTGIETNDVKGS